MICVIFDLDGTLTDSHEGILKSIRHALTSMNYPIPDEKTLQLFIGPPLADSFKEHCHMKPITSSKNGMILWGNMKMQCILKLRKP